jgi:1,4-alpha-glucan branching enzyme
MPALEGVSHLYLVGDFNDWSIVSQPLTRGSEGAWVITLPLDGGRAYQFRYFDNNGHWHNDWQADAYVSNQFGGDNSLVQTYDDENGPAPAGAALVTSQAPKRRAAPRKKAAEGEAGAAPAARKRAAPRKKKAE